MDNFYPFLLQPEFVERVWGARDLSPLYEHSRASDSPVGEVWLTGDGCRVQNGPLAGCTVAQLAKKFGSDLVGEAANQFDRFPLLIKFLFPREKLSVQVHPDDDGARHIGQSCGKTECWYVLAAEPGAQVGLGLKPGVTRPQLEAAIEEARAEELLNWINLQPGDLIYVEAGTVHAIGAGAVIVETQQNSDTTYRLYDYGRGRELHVCKGLDAAKEKTHSGKVARVGANGNLNLITAPCFVVNKRTLPHAKEHLITRHMPPSSAQILVGLDGSATVLAKGCEPVQFSRGEAVIVPAVINNFGVRPLEHAEYLHIALPQDAVKHPQTSLI